MYGELYRYFIQHNHLDVPGVGTFLLEKRAARFDFPNKRMDPPGYAIAFQTAAHTPSRKFFAWLATALGITDREAVVRFNDFAFDIKKRLSDGATITWLGLGTLRKASTGEIQLDPADKDLVFQRPVRAEKVLRENAQHVMRVGEQEKTSSQMVELLTQTQEVQVKRSYWWAYALVTAILAIIFIGWYLSEHGVTPSATANQQKLTPRPFTASYQELR